jgi:glucoamylase
MPRDIPIGNGSLLILYDNKGLLRDLYFPSVGSENHAQGHVFKVGVWVNGVIAGLRAASHFTAAFGEIKLS